MHVEGVMNGELQCTGRGPRHVVDVFNLEESICLRHIAFSQIFYSEK